MPSFSQRKGIVPIEKLIQREEVDEQLRNRLWSALQISIWNYWDGNGFDDASSLSQLAIRIWIDFLKLPLDKFQEFDPRQSWSCYTRFREHFFKCKWNEVYDFIEFVLSHCPEEWEDSLRTLANKYLEEENAAYRVIEYQVCDISDENEIDAIEDALKSPFANARQHLSRSLELLSDKQNPDHRNAVKEAISALESASQEFSGKSGATLGDCVKAMEKAGALHPAFKEYLLKLYGYTNDSGGIRHALSDRHEPPTYAEAKFMLVSCSAFINLLVAKRAEMQS